MTVELKEMENTVTARITGRIDTTTAPQLQEALENVGRDKKLVLDFADVQYISSAGLRVLLMMRKRFPGDGLDIVNVSDEVNEIFQVTGFDRLLPVQLAPKSQGSWLNLSLAGFLKRKLAEDPDYPAITYGEEIYTWKDLDRLSQVVAMDLSAQGVKKGTHVGIMGMNSINWVLTFFAVQKLGGIAMLLNFNLTPEELQKLSRVGDITHLCYGDIPYLKDPAPFLAAVTDEKSSEFRYTYSISSAIHVRDREGEYEALKGLFADTVGADDPAVVIFTSGSTGKPKAVLHSAYNLLNSANGAALNFRLSSADAACLVLPLFHIFGLTCAFLAALLSDCRVVIPASLRTTAVLETIARTRCTQISSVPTFLLALIHNPSFDTRMVESVKCCTMGGGPVTPTQLADIQKNFPNAFMGVGYGLSEMTPVTMTAYQDTDYHVINTIGKLIGDVQARVADPATGKEVPQGTEGELLLRGFNTMAGYYRMPLEDQPLDEEGWLHTGDMAAIEPDGYIRITGRIKDMIIRGGENIIPREIELVMTQHPDIADAKCVGIPNPFYGEIVGAAIVTRSGKDVDPAELKAFLAGRLAAYKIPECFFRYDGFPMLPNGKIDAVNLKKDVIARAKAAAAAR